MKWLAIPLIMSIAAGISVAASPETVRYTVRFPEPSTHYAQIEAIFPASRQSTLEVFMPVWTPGSYLVREYARQVESPSAADEQGHALAVAKSAKNRWRIEANGAAEVRFSYKVYCREMSVRTNWVEDSFALLNGAPTFVTLVTGPPRPHDVQLVLPPAWKTSITGLSEAADGTPHHYTAPDYDTLVDSPILAGNPSVYKFEVDGIPHFLANQGEEGIWDGHRAAADIEKIVRAQRDFWGSLPYRKYVFLNLITEAGGGLEHANSMCVMTNRFSTSTRRAYTGWLGLVSHELFHAWNIKRLRPFELGPFDYERENPTRSLWVAEGVTDYYGHLLLHRAGLTTRSEYLGEGAEPGSLSAMINTLQTTPGRLVQSAEQASEDAWIKLYRPDENTNNTSISYYTKGAVAGWLLDAHIRHATGGAKSLDDVMRLAFTRFSGDRGFTPEQFKATAEEVTGKSLRDFFAQAVESTEELDYSEAMAWFGLRFRQAVASRKPWLGAETKIDNGRLIVSRVPRDTPALHAGMDVDDEILGVGDFRVRPEQLAQRLENYQPGQTVSLLVARREKLIRLNLTLGEDPPKRWQLESDPGATAALTKRLQAWLTR